MSAARQGWLVARRELRERIRSRSLWGGTAVMLLVVVGAIVVPALTDSGTVTRDVGFTGTVPEDLPRVLRGQGDAVDVKVDVRHYDDEVVGEEAVRDGDVDVLVHDGRRLAWRGEPDERLRALVTGAIQLVAMERRAAAVGISPGALAALSAPVPVENEELAVAAGRSPDDETAASVMSLLLLAALATYGQLVLTGVVQEKSSRVVEVLLARMPARNLLAGKVAGIGLLGFAQFALAAVAALAATLAVDSVDVPAVSAEVLAWVVAWFVLGYVMYAMAYGAFGSLASRTEDASSIAAPATAVLIVSYWASFVAVSTDPESGWSQLFSLFPATAPFAMPGRIALGAAAWWELLVAVALTLGAVAGLVALAGRVYTGAILHGGVTVRLRDAWARGRAAPGNAVRGEEPGLRQASPRGLGRRGGGVPTRSANGTTTALLAGVSAVAGLIVIVLVQDVVMGIGVGFGVYAVASRVARTRRHPA